MHKHDVYLPDNTLAAFCHHWQITELALFGSILRNDFGPESDVDFLVTYAPNKRREPWGYCPEQVEMESLIGRKVDWITRKSVEQGRNPLFQREVLTTAETIYAVFPKSFHALHATLEHEKPLSWRVARPGEGLG